MEEKQKIPEINRILENVHIIFWLIKDLSWAMLWKPIGLLMIIPTLGAALVIFYQTRRIRSEMFHNLAVILWIIANAYWMISEFFFTDDSLRRYASIPFVMGLALIAYYYIDLAIRRRASKVKAS